MRSYRNDTVKTEKERAMISYQRLHKIAIVVRTLELFLALILLSWSSTYLPEALSFAVGNLRRISGVVLSPHFVFLLGNAIIVTLFATSGHFSASDAGKLDAGSGYTIVEPEITRLNEKQDVELEAAVTIGKPKVKKSEVKKSEVREYRRTRSEVAEVTAEKKVIQELRRSETEPRRKRRSSGKVVVAAEAEELSNEEFRRRVEAFIEKQQRLLREESMSMTVVLMK